MEEIKKILAAENSAILTQPNDSAGVILLAKILENSKKSVFHIARDDKRMAELCENLAFFFPEIEIVTIPAWDCLPYDRISPSSFIMAKRVEGLCRLANLEPGKKIVVITTINSLVQKVPPKEVLAKAALFLEKGKNIAREKIINFLASNGYIRMATATESGEFAVRGSILDIFPPGREEGLRIDFFGDEIDGIRTFDPVSQISLGKIEKVNLIPANEIIQNEDSTERFLEKYRTLFGAVVYEDPLFEAVKEGRKYPGLEHWLALFYEKLMPITSLLEFSSISFDEGAENLIEERLSIINEYYQTRQENIKNRQGDGYKPVPPEYLYLQKKELRWQSAMIHFSNFKNDKTIDIGLKPIPNFNIVAKEKGRLVFDELRDFLTLKMMGEKKKVIISAYSEGSKARLLHIISEHEIAVQEIEKFNEIIILQKKVGLTRLDLESGFEYSNLVFISEQDILGEKIGARHKKKARPEKVLFESYNLAQGEIVVHKEHGIGRFEGLENVKALGTEHACIKLVYHGGDRLYIPVENIEVISKYGSEESVVALDKLGGVQWQSRKARLKDRIKLTAQELMTVAAARELKKADALYAEAGLFDEFEARFPYTETDDQLRAIEEVINDLSSGKPMDRLICGDVGFGKTEVAMRAAFVALGERVMGNRENEGGQIAVVAPTTLLARQHFKTFSERFANLPIEIRQLSRMVSAKNAADTKQMIAEGTADIVIGTHALLAKNINFKKLSLLVIDEEQHFGVAQKEALKKLRSETHVLTLSATPIPRTLQLSLTGIRELSLITTPPVDRLAVRTHVMPFDAVVIREALMRERARGGRSFYVCPRIKDLEDVEKELKRLVPELKIAVAYGKLTPATLDEIMNNFYDGKYDILLSTSIIESGIDIAAANTMIVHRADMFGLSQLYQLRGRVGRSKTRAYAYFTLPPRRVISEGAMKRLEVMQKLDNLGAGFTLATYDMDIRGFGNLLGDEQSGNIREVGIELYQEMLREAVDEVKRSNIMKGDEAKPDFSPQINIGASVLIPEHYIADLTLRIGLYRRIAGLETEQEVESIAVELVDRFGPMPEEVEHLLQVVKLKQICKKLMIDKLEAGPKGAVITFKDNKFSNPEAVINFIGENLDSVKLRPDQKIAFINKEWENTKKRIRGVRDSLKKIATLAA